MSHTDDMALYTKEYIMSNQGAMSIHTNVKHYDHLFNCDHSAQNPTSASDFEYHLTHWVESKNPGIQVACTLKRDPAPHVYVVDIAVLMVQSGLFSSVNGRMDISFVIINGRSMAGRYEEFIVKLDGADLSRLDDIV